MGFRSYFVCSHTVVRNYSSALISQDRLTVIWINLNSFSDAVSANLTISKGKFYL
jgi:hypothetical protein